MTHYIRFEEWEAKKLADPEFRKAAERLEPAYQIARLRIMRGLTQKDLAKKIGTKQSSIARLESGRHEPNISFLRKVVEALRGKLILQIIPEEEFSVEIQPTLADASVHRFSFGKSEPKKSEMDIDFASLIGTESRFEKVGP